ncbi:tRNA-uridine aminocarboxypropyltransferase [Marinomonas transparens]|uniref:tRNA-uridine aminocarboxypropyltransferase n=1 Tax=Marinomonas transparens TaxID=2795388 RepID=A0A934JUD8_9GAMM|nr:tRNA-uridine aminocarboxypropyltransferase [Marinomonas transparens]MBJ7538472.1 DTW domain-containing protein [Marinomonas transparens]
MQVETRAYCEVCGFLVVQCVCRWLSPISTSIQILVIQEAKEAKHAKNTVSLLRLALPQVTCIDSDDKEKLLSTLSELDYSKWRLVYPCEGAVDIETLDHESSSRLEGIILLDGTWRKAKKLYLTDPLLHKFNAVKFAMPPACQYDIRKSPNGQALSTLEACAYAVEQITGQSMQALRDFMVSSQRWQWRKRPLADDSH